jgi:hypothetical protein
MLRKSLAQHAFLRSSIEEDVALPDFSVAIGALQVLLKTEVVVIRFQVESEVALGNLTPQMCHCRIGSRRDSKERTQIL